MKTGDPTCPYEKCPLPGLRLKARKRWPLSIAAAAALVFTAGGLVATLDSHGTRLDTAEKKIESIDDKVDEVRADVKVIRAILEKP